MVAAAVYNARRTKRSDRVWQPGDFVREPRREMTPEEMERVMDAFVAQQKGAAEA